MMYVCMLCIHVYVYVYVYMWMCVCCVCMCMCMLCIQYYDDDVSHLYNVGMLETIRIRKAGFPVRRPYQEFCDYFMMIDPAAKVAGDFKARCVFDVSSSSSSTAHARQQHHYQQHTHTHTITISTHAQQLDDDTTSTRRATSTNQQQLCIYDNGTSSL